MARQIAILDYLGAGGTDVRIYDMDDDLTLGSLSFVTEVNFPNINSTEGAYLSPDGTKFFVRNRTTSNRIDRYTLSTPFDFTTASNDQNIIYSTECRPGVFSPDGTKWLVSHWNGAAWGIQAFTLSTPWDMTSRSTSGSNLALSNTGTTRQVLLASEDGTKFLSGYVSSEIVFEWNLTTGWNTNAGSETSRPLGTAMDRIYGIAAHEDGLIVLASQHSSVRLGRYVLNNPYDFSSVASFTEVSPLTDVSQPFSLLLFGQSGGPFVGFGIPMGISP